MTLMPDSGNAEINFYNYGSVQFGGTELKFYQSRGTKASPQNVQNGDYVLTLTPTVRNGSYYGKPIIDSRVFGTVGSGDEVPLITSINSWSERGGVGAYISLLPNGSASVNGGSSSYSNASLSVDGDLGADTIFSNYASFDELNINKLFTFPTADGTSGQVLQTNGSGSVSWGSIAASPWSSNTDSISTSNKFVGIGTNSPLAKLHVVDTVGFGNTIGIYNKVRDSLSTGSIYGYKGSLAGKNTDRLYGIDMDIIASENFFTKNIP